jgi:hypothetical protein
MTSDRERLAYLREQALPTIRERGWMVASHARPGQTGGEVSYTAGLTEAGRAELLVARLPSTLAAVILNDVARTHLSRALSPGMEVPAAGGGWVRVVDAPGALAPVARSLYGRHARFLQLLWGMGGVYPDSPSWSASYPAQPIYSVPLPDSVLPTSDGLVGLLDRHALNEDTPPAGG